MRSEPANPSGDRLADTIGALTAQIAVTDSDRSFEAATNICLASRRVFTMLIDTIAWVDGPVEPTILHPVTAQLERAVTVLGRVAQSDPSEVDILRQYARSVSEKAAFVRRVADGESVDQLLAQLISRHDFEPAKEEPPKPSEIRVIPFTPEHYSWLLEDLKRLRTLSPGAFEELVADRMYAMGLEVRLLGEANRADGGVDIVAWPREPVPFPFLLAAQVKHHRTNRKTPVRDIREFHGVVSSAGAPFHCGLIATNTFFTPEAQWFARSNQKLLRLRDVDDLARWMKDDFRDEVALREFPKAIQLTSTLSLELDIGRRNAI